MFLMLFVLIIAAWAAWPMWLTVQSGGAYRLLDDATFATPAHPNGPMVYRIAAWGFAAAVAFLSMGLMGLLGLPIALAVVASLPGAYLMRGKNIESYDANALVVAKTKAKRAKLQSNDAVVRSMVGHRDSADVADPGLRKRNLRARVGRDPPGHVYDASDARNSSTPTEAPTNSPLAFVLAEGGSGYASPMDTEVPQHMLDADPLAGDRPLSDVYYGES